GDMRSESLGLDKINVKTRASASASISILDAAIHKVSVQRTKIGSYQNELEYNTNSLKETSLHMQESESRITDADMASEYIEFVKLQILNQSGTSMLSQANQNSQSIMNILQM
ncbi:MAG: flagellin, partial [Synergistaceae bacterium]|nr:flagellin [Synergistaceae bacterium]